MTRIAAVVAVVLALSAGTANAAPPPQAQIDTLKAQVAALQKTVKTLQSDLKKTQTALDNTVDVFSAISACEVALTADALQGTWGIVDQLLVAAGKPAAWGPQAAVNDFNACGLLSKNAIVHGIVSPGTVTNFSALIQLLHG